MTGNEHSLEVNIGTKEFSWKHLLFWVFWMLFATALFTLPDIHEQDLKKIELQTIEAQIRLLELKENV